MYKHQGDKREDLYDDGKFSCSITWEREDMPFAHCAYSSKDDVKGMLKTSRKVFEDVKSMLSNRGAEFVFTYTPSVRYIKIMAPGFDKVDLVGGTPGWDLLAWDLRGEDSK